jgi:hypothetical protein
MLVLRGKFKISKPHMKPQICINTLILNDDVEYIVYNFENLFPKYIYQYLRNNQPK